MKNLFSICIIGSGNVASHMAIALKKAGHSVKGIYSRTLAHARELAEKTDAAVATDQLQTLPEADIYIFAVKDDALPEVAQTFALQHPRTNALIAHTAGSIPLTTLPEELKHTAVIYPMQTFSKSSLTESGVPLDFSNLPLFVEGNTPEALQTITILAQSLSQNVTPLNSEGRRKLHLSAVIACNFANHCYAMAYRLLQEADIDPHCLLPLIEETTHKLKTLHPVEAQTGPAARWDKQVMEMQMKDLAPYPDMQAIYKAMSLDIHSYHDKLRPEKDSRPGL